MNNAQLAATIAVEAIAFMAKKAGCTEVEVLAAIHADPTGNAARYFADLAGAAIHTYA